MAENMIPLGREAAQVLRTKECLYTALFKLLKTCAYEDITIGQICRKADYSRAVFYNHYHNKEEFFTEIFNRIMELYRYKIEQAAEAGLLTKNYTYVVFLKVLQRNRDFFLLLEHNGVQRLLSEFFMHEPDVLYPKFAHEGTPASQQFQTYFLRYHSEGLSSLCMQWLHEETPLPPEQFAKILQSLYCYDHIRYFLSRENIE